MFEPIIILLFKKAFTNPWFLYIQRVNILTFNFSRTDLVIVLTSNFQFRKLKNIEMKRLRVLGFKFYSNKNFAINMLIYGRRRL